MQARLLFSINLAHHWLNSVLPLFGLAMPQFPELMPPLAPPCNDDPFLMLRPAPVGRPLNPSSSLTIKSHSATQPALLNPTELASCRQWLHSRRCRQTTSLSVTTWIPAPPGSCSRQTGSGPTNSLCVSHPFEDQWPEPSESHSLFLLIQRYFNWLAACTFNLKMLHIMSWSSPYVASFHITLCSPPPSHPPNLCMQSNVEWFSVICPSAGFHLISASAGEVRGRDVNVPQIISHMRWFLLEGGPPPSLSSLLAAASRFCHPGLAVLHQD